MNSIDRILVHAGFRLPLSMCPRKLPTRQLNVVSLEMLEKREGAFDRDCDAIGNYHRCTSGQNLDGKTMEDAQNDSKRSRLEGTREDFEANKKLNLGSYSLTIRQDKRSPPYAGYNVRSYRWDTRLHLNVV